MPSPRLCIIAIVLTLLLLAPGSPASAAPPEETRPYLELPFPSGTSYKITCGYSCYQHRGSMTYAVDFAIPEGDPIVAAAPGEVMAVTWEVGLPVSLNLGDALIVYIDHGEGWFTRYVHLDGVTVEVGDTVEMGDVIGYGGKTGASGDHLHFELKYGTSLHSPSVPINELFGGADPIAGEYPVSNNWSLADKSLTEPLVETPTPTATIPAPEASENFQSRLPFIETGLALSAPTVAAGLPLTGTFTLRNNSAERLHLAMLGIAARTPDGQMLDDALFFDRAIVLNPDRTYEFSKAFPLTHTGELELFIFALGAHNEWIPLDGSAQSVQITVTAPPTTIYLPLVGGAPPTAPLEQPVPDAPTATPPSPTPTEPPPAPEPSVTPTLQPDEPEGMRSARP